MPAPSRPNPYAPKPEGFSSRGKSKYVPSGRRVLANRGSRIGALLIDGFIATPLSVLAQLLILLGGDVGWWLGVVIGIGGSLILAVVQIVLLVRTSATIGKRLMGIYIADHASGKPADWVQTILLRGIVWAFVLGVPLIGMPILCIADIVYFFRDDRRCLHDHFAKTVVYQR